MTEAMTARHRAAAILSGHKLRMLEEAGLMVVGVEEQQSLVEHLKQALNQWRMYAGDDRMGDPFPLPLDEDTESNLWYAGYNAMNETQDAILDHGLRLKGLMKDG